MDNQLPKSSAQVQKAIKHAPANRLPLAELPRPELLRRANSESHIGNAAPKLTRSASTLSKPAATTTARRTLVKSDATVTSRTVARATGTTATVGTGAVNKVATRSNSLAKRVSTVTTKIPVTSVKSPIAAGAAPVQTKPKIPPYDFKARLLDLQEKYKVLRGRHQVLLSQLGDLETLPELFEEQQIELQRVKKELTDVQLELECVQRQNVAYKADVTRLTHSTKYLSETLDGKIGEIRATKKMFDLQETEKAQLAAVLRDSQQDSYDVMGENDNLHREMAALKNELFKSHAERKEMHNRIMAMRGNFRVFCRVRRPTDSEMERKMYLLQYYGDASLEISNSDVTKHGFSFDKVFAPNSKQTDIFEMVTPMIQSALDGYSICIFAYGQTGSGKTYTMDGVANDRDMGIIPRTINQLFHSIDRYKSLGLTYEVSASFLEVYNEILYDLLSYNAGNISMCSSMHSNEVPVHSSGELYGLWRSAKLAHSVKTLVRNDQLSWQSHVIFRVHLKYTHPKMDDFRVSTMNFVDLAGSEDVIMDRSLSEMTSVIKALQQRLDHTQHGSSMLTQLLMPSLDDHSKVAAFIHVAPFKDCFEESVKCLRYFASQSTRARATARVNQSAAPVSTIFEDCFGFIRGLFGNVTYHQQE